MRYLSLSAIVFSSLFCSKTTVAGQCCRLECANSLFSWNACCEEGNGEVKDVLVTDRPDFTEASTTVGLGRVQVELGYTHTYDNDGNTSRSEHSYPEPLLRVGLFANWFELRIVWNLLDETITTAGARATSVGSDDMQIGAKIALTEQCGCLPSMSIIPQMNVPTGSSGFTSDEVLPGLNWIYAWDINDRLSLAGSTQGNRVVDSTGHTHLEMAQSVAAGLGLTDQLGSYLEWFAFMPHSAREAGVGPNHFLNGGFTWLENNNLQYDIRAGLGLNDEAADYFIGAGLSFRL